MIVIMNLEGKFAFTSTVNNHAGKRLRASWGELDHATLFPDVLRRIDYEGCYEELMSGIFIPAKEDRKVVLLK
jgi:hypothetical protein